MRYGIITLTKGALHLALQVKEHFADAVVYAPAKWKHPATTLITGSFTDFVGTIFTRHQTLVFIMATGIVVRSIAPHLKGKTVDPAVLVMDEKGRFVISLLSGHLGGANEEAERFSKKMGAVPVITTASDVINKEAVDMLAKRLDCVIDDMERAKTVTAMIINDEPVCLLSDYPVAIPDYLKTPRQQSKGGIIISHKKTISMTGDTWVRLIPRTIVIGIGCRKGVPEASVITLINEYLARLDIDPRSIKALATIDIKKDEPAIIHAATCLDVELRIIDKAAVLEVEAQFTGSNFVKQSVGVSAVCEPCAYLASNKTGRMILPKQAKDGVTIAIWEDELENNNR